MGAETEVSQTPLVSVCAPAHNDAAFIKESLRSILDQTYEHLEILVGDDASTDETPKRIQAFNDERLYYYRNPTNLGQFENVNSLVQRASGKYVAVYHADDIYEPDIVEREVRFLEDHPQAGAVFALDHRITRDGELIGTTELPEGVEPNTCLGLNDLMPPLLRHKNRILRTPTFMGRTDIFETVGLFRSDLDIAGDFEMWLRILTAYKIGIIDEPLVHYRHSDTQVSARYDYLRTCEEHFFPIMDAYLQNADLNGIIGEADRVEYAFHRCDDRTFRAANHVIQGNYDQAQSLLTQDTFPWATFRNSIQRRKLRVVLLRALLQIGLRAGAQRPLARFIRWFEYGE